MLAPITHIGLTARIVLSHDLHCRHQPTIRDRILCDIDAGEASPRVEDAAASRAKGFRCALEACTHRDLSLREQRQRVHRPCRRRRLVRRGYPWFEAKIVDIGGGVEDLGLGICGPSRARTCQPKWRAEGAHTVTHLCPLILSYPPISGSTQPL